ncbi:MAG: hypothetical protein HDR71_18210 [Lachnospiraceae bacterium]|nr:hypothetical protein [Lachnospiraceae bacterium]
MDTLNTLIEKVDDDYLTGLCNKGTVKRAYKDLEQESPHLERKGEEVQISLKEETCRIRIPLGESTCSCPSRSICRHIITAILWLKHEFSEKIHDEFPEEIHDEISEETSGEEKAHPSGPLQELLQIPAERLKRACKISRFRQFMGHMKAGELPSVKESSIVTVYLPWEEATVKLLEPFEYSTCTCHSKELCAHKAQAVLAYQIEKGKISLQDLENLKEAENVYDIPLVKQTCQSVREDISGQICVGLSRQSPEIAESLERLAVIVHRAGLPDLESLLREAASLYGQYFERSAAFRSEELLKKLLLIYRKAGKLENAENQEEIRTLAGTFRDTYEPAGKLQLMSMGGRSFTSKNGYEGEIYYFLETQKKEWYTWTDARPVFYEGTRRRPPGNSENALAPWGLNCSREKMQELEFELQNAKAAYGGRLSVSQDSKAEIMGMRSLQKEEVRQMIVWDYEELLDNKKKTPEKLALVGTVRWDETSFDTVQQRFSWRIYDRLGRSLYISIKYSKEERITINFLERLYRKLKEREQKAIIFFGSLYLDEEGRLCLFPIEFFLKEAEELLQYEISRDTGSNVEAAAKTGTLKTEDLKIMKQYHREALHQLSDLFASGLDSVQEDTIEQITQLAEEGERLGLHFAGKNLENIAEHLREKRHRLLFSPEPVLITMGQMEAYLNLCKEKLSYDTALLAMRETKEIENREGDRP